MAGLILRRPGNGVLRSQKLRQNAEAYAFRRRAYVRWPT